MIIIKDGLVDFAKTFDDKYFLVKHDGIVGAGHLVRCDFVGLITITLMLFSLVVWSGDALE